MNATVNSIKVLLEKRLEKRLNALEAIASSPLDILPEAIQTRREDEASKIRAVVQEQRDILDIINHLFPNI
jgi:BMFP domain-containing protein YqiC